MYHTLSSGFRDNSSVYSGSSNTTGGSAFHNSRGIPRSNSTSDLFEIPGNGAGGNSRKPRPSKTGLRAPLKANPRSNSLQHIPVSQGLPNGYNRGRFPEKQTLPHGIYKSASCSSSNYNIEPRISLNSIPEKRQPHYVLTPYQLQRKQMKDPFQFPNGENFTPRNQLPRSSSSSALSKGPALQPLSRSQSMNSLPPRPVQLQKQFVVVAPSPMPGSGSSSSSYNSMKDHSGSDSTNQSSRPSTHSSNTNLPSTAGKPRSPLALGIELQLPKESPRTVLSPRESILNRSTSVKRKNSNTPSDGKENSNKSPKKNGSSSRLGNFFKKIFSRHSSRSSSPAPSLTSSRIGVKKKRLRVDPNVPVPSPQEDSAKSKPPKSVGEEFKSAATEGGSKPIFKVGLENDSSAEDENDDDGDDPLMDTDLVFDSLLLKADSNRPSAIQKQIDLGKKMKEMRSSEAESSRELVSVHSRREKSSEESNIDYELISEFSRLGKFIEKCDARPENWPSNLPLRSPRRPNIGTKDSARSFYRPSRKDLGSSHNLIDRLYREWKVVHLDASIQSKKALLEDKELRFGEDIYVNDTWSPIDYERSDKKFIRNRRRLMQLKDKGFIETIKSELNEYKRNDMIVHQESTQYTHFFP